RRRGKRRTRRSGRLSSRYRTSPHATQIPQALYAKPKRTLSRIRYTTYGRAHTSSWQFIARRRERIWASSLLSGGSFCSFSGGAPLPSALLHLAKHSLLLPE